VWSWLSAIPVDFVGVVPESKCRHLAPNCVGVTAVERSHHPRLRQNHVARKDAPSSRSVPMRCPSLGLLPSAEVRAARARYVEQRSELAATNSGGNRSIHSSIRPMSPL